MTSELEFPMESQSIRIAPDSCCKLRELAASRGEPLDRTMQAAVDLLYREWFLDACHRAYADLKSRPDAWQEVQTEQRVWDATLADGLEGV